MEKLNIAIDMTNHDSHNNYLTLRNYQATDENDLLEDIQEALDNYKKSKEQKSCHIDYDLYNLKSAAYALLKREKILRKMQNRENRINILTELVLESIEVNQGTTIERLAGQIREQFPAFCERREGKTCLPIGLSKEILFRLCENNNFIKADYYYIRIK